MGLLLRFGRGEALGDLLGELLIGGEGSVGGSLVFLDQISDRVKVAPFLLVDKDNLQDVEEQGLLLVSLVVHLLAPRLD